ncbi:MAG: hypothetical protein HY898_12665 [Deltaproteobacteria bacterium]|nr:hypothetical protein [Deltaproteobacteria bacterium]
MADPTISKASSNWTTHLRTGLLVIALLAGLLKFGTVVHEHYPIHRWLFWLYAKYWVLIAFWTAGCVSTGHMLLKRLLGRTLPLVEHAVMSFCVGLFAFFALMFLGGLLKLYGVIFFVALPALMIGAGARPVFRYGRRMFRHVRAARARRPAPTPWWHYPLLGFGGVGVFLIYLTVLLPENVGYDARWYHLPIAEHYSAAGGIVRFPEGWFPGTGPHLASVLYAWAFQQPFSGIFDRVELAAHMEFAIFLWTLASIPALVRRLVPRTHASVSWVAMFLFPGILLYDSSLNTGADHIAGFWAIPVYLTLLRAWKSLSPRYCLLLAIPLSGALMTKLTAVSIGAFPILAIVVRTVWLLISRLRRGRDLPELRGWWRGVLIAAVAGLVLMSPHWLKNWIWYGDPFYPILHNHLHLRPWTAGSENIMTCCSLADWHPTRDVAGLKETLKALYTYSFVPNDWETFHGKVPVFGSLFTVTLLCMPFLRNTKRLWGVFLAGHVGLFVWYSIHHQDRYLQAIVPWMVAATASVLILAWRSHPAVRVPVVLVVAAQVIWGGDVYFIPTHSMIYAAPIVKVTELLNSGYRKDYENRLRPYSPFADVGRQLDRHKHVLLVHDDMQHLGVRVRSVSDDPAFQGGIDYASLRSPKQVYDLLDGMGITHVYWSSVRGRASLASDLIFYDVALKYLTQKKQVAGANLGQLPIEAPTDAPFGDIVGVYGCSSEQYKQGLYHLHELTHFPADAKPAKGFPKPFQPAPAAEALRAQLLQADFIIYDTACHQPFPAGLEDVFESLARRDHISYWVKKTSP